MPIEKLQLVEKWARVAPTANHPNSPRMKIIDGHMHRTRVYVHSERKGEVDEFPLGCQLCNACPGWQTYLHLTPSVSGIEDRHTEPTTASVYVCSNCIAAIAALWENAGRPSEGQYLEVLEK